MKILLIDPPGWQKGVLNVGLAYLASSLKRKGFDVQVADANNNSLSDEVLLNIVSDHDPTIIGYSINTGTVSSAVRMAKKTKELFPDSIHVAGGPHISLFYQEFLTQNREFDYAFLQEAEDTFPLFCEKLSNGDSISDVSGIAFINENHKLISRQLEKFPDPNSLSFPDYGKSYPYQRELLQKRYPVVTSRGCPYNCIFCTASKICGKKWRGRFAQDVIEELKLAKSKYGIQRFDIVDDNFTLNLKRTKQFCRLLTDEKVGLEWTCPNGIRADKVDQELAEVMRESGCDMVCIGVESGDKEVFGAIKKGETLQEIEKSIRLLKSVGIKVTGLFIIGLPGDNLKKFNKSLEFVKKTELDDAWFGLLIPFRGTEVYKWVDKNGRFLRDFDEAQFFGPDARPIFETDQFTEKEMIKCYQKACTVTGNLGRVIPGSVSEFKREKFKRKLLWKYDRTRIKRHLFSFLIIQVANEKMWAFLKKIYSLSKRISVKIKEFVKKT